MNALERISHERLSYAQKPYSKIRKGTDVWILKYMDSTTYVNSNIIILCLCAKSLVKGKPKFHMAIELSFNYNVWFHFTMMSVHFYLQKILTHQISWTDNQYLSRRVPPKGDPRNASSVRYTARKDSKAKKV